MYSPMNVRSDCTYFDMVLLRYSDSQAVNYWSSDTDLNPDVQHKINNSEGSINSKRLVP
jgi:hypothetical protein